MDRADSELAVISSMGWNVKIDLNKEIEGWIDVGVELDKEAEIEFKVNIRNN